MRTSISILAALMFISSLLCLATGTNAESNMTEATPWVGAYLKFARYDTMRQGQFGEAQQVTITKDGDAYYLSKPYEQWKFTEIEKGVLSDGKGGIGKLYLGFTEFADGKRVRVLRAEFCYEQFILYGDLEEPVVKPELPAK